MSIARAVASAIPSVDLTVSAVLVTGDVPLVGDYSDATAVVYVDSIGLLNAVSRFNHGTDVGVQSIGQPTAFNIGVTLNPGAEDLDREVRRFEYKLEAGADFVVTYWAKELAGWH